jgi:hypothetical protein
MAVILIDTHNCSREEKQELIQYLDEQSWDFKIEAEEVEEAIAIDIDDVYKVANDLCIGLTDEQVKEVLELYPSEQEEDPSATWDLVVENIIHNL